DGTSGLLVLDAFTSDAIPVHLLTREAIAEYLGKLQRGGLLAFHISNVYVNLEPVLANIARDLRCVACVRDDNQITEDERLRGKSPSVWMVIAESPAILEPLLAGGRWRNGQTRPGVSLWTDDRSDMWSVFRFHDR